MRTKVGDKMKTQPKENHKDLPKFNFLRSGNS